MSLKRAVVFTGLVRQPDKFQQLLAFQIERQHPSVQWVISTWDEEYATHIAAFEQAIAQGFRIILCDQPMLIGPGHIVHQKLSLFNALEALDDDTYVLKGRIDFLNLQWVDEFLKTEPQSAGSRSVFTRRVKAHAFFLTEPFYINDITFIGMARDLAILCELDLIAMEHTVNLGAEQAFHSSAFLRSSPWLRDYYKINAGLVFGERDAVESFHATACENRYFLSVIAAYFGELLTNYQTFYNYPYRPGAFDAMSAYQFLCVPGDGFEYNESCSRKLGGSLKSLEILRQRSQDDTSLGFLVKQLNAYLAGEMAFDVSDRSVFAEAVHAHFPQVLSRTSAAASETNPTRLMRSARWQVSGGDTGLVNHLQNEISHLRRLVEQKAAKKL